MTIAQEKSLTHEFQGTVEDLGFLQLVKLSVPVAHPTLKAKSGEPLMIHHIQINAVPVEISPLEDGQKVKGHFEIRDVKSVATDITLG